MSTETMAASWPSVSSEAAIASSAINSHGGYGQKGAERIPHIRLRCCNRSSSRSESALRCAASAIRAEPDFPAIHLLPPLGRMASSVVICAGEPLCRRRTETISA